LVLRSRKPQGRAFKRRITHEVIPPEGPLRHVEVPEEEGFTFDAVAEVLGAERGRP
jgi:hypothetical protein